MQLTTFTQDRSGLIAEILPLFKLHAKIANTSEDLLLERYIGAAISAAENYLMRDVWPTTREWSGNFAASEPFIARHGRAKTIAILDAAGQPAAVDGYTLLSSADPKTWGFEITSAAGWPGGTVTAVLGFATFAEMPDDLQAFILQAAGAFYEVRELANYGGGSQGVETASFLPLYLLDTWANLTYA